MNRGNNRHCTQPGGLNQLLKDKRYRKIPKPIYYAGLKRLASPNLKAIWKGFRRLGTRLTRLMPVT